MNRFLAIILVASLLISACQSAPEKHYALKAEVISVDAPRKLITVVHGAIPGLMPAMTMTYAVSDAKEIEQLAPGDFITADLVVSDNKGRLEKIAKGKPASSRRNSALARRSLVRNDQSLFLDPQFILLLQGLLDVDRLQRFIQKAMEFAITAPVHHRG